MFTRLAKSKLADFKLGDSDLCSRGALRCAGPDFSTIPPSNDNLPGLRRPKGQRRIPTPAPACHWFNRDGRLECRWQAEPNGDAPMSDFGEHRTIGGAAG